jgi:hypothetical protein
MSALASSLPSPRMVWADLLKLRRRRGLVVVTSLLTVGAVILTYGLIELFHLANPARYGRPAGSSISVTGRSSSPRSAALQPSSLARSRAPATSRPGSIATWS